MLVTALIMGFAGSLHCIGMCSPLAMAVSNMNPAAFLTRIVYNTGRVMTYGILGAIVSSVGHLIPIAKFQNLFSILLGIALLLIGVGLLKTNIPGLSKGVAHFTFYIKNMFAIFLHRKNIGATFILGTLNGLLPCGLVLVALTYCITLTSTFDGLTFMLMFGAGTLPVMLGLTSVLPNVLKRMRLNIQYATMSMMIMAGVVLIARVFILHLPHNTSIQQGVIDIVLCK